jgi:NADPH:quinone reductase-like Zn-dependent oxidoreductase
MFARATAWFLYRGSSTSIDERGCLVREDFELPDIEDDEVLAEPLYGSWEGNMGHALARKPVDICAQRGEDRVVIGNSGVVRVLDVGKQVSTVRPGDHAILFGSDQVDRFGYGAKMLGYDAAGTMGCLATKMKAHERNFIAVPPNTKHALARWGAFSVRYITAFANWPLALGTLRLLVDRDKLPQPNVWGWGGGTTFAQLDLARRAGCRATMLSGNASRLEVIRESGVTALDRRQFGDLSFDERRYSTDPKYRRAYVSAENAFIAEIQRLTEGLKVQIFVDYIGTSVFRATMKALGRPGVICTAGWKEGMVINFLRAVECMEHHQHLHTHYARRDQGLAAVAYAEANDWMPPIDDRIYTFDEIPALAEDYTAGRVGMFPVYSVNPE